MKRLALLAALPLLVAAPATAVPYSGDTRVGARLSDVRVCQGDVTVYEVALRNDTRKPRTFRAFEVDGGEKVSDRRHVIPRRTRAALMFYVPAGERRTVTVTHAGEVIVHRTIRGICY